MNIAPLSDRPRIESGDAAIITDLRVETVPSAIEGLWRRFEAEAVGHVFQSYDWTTAWLDHVGAARAIEARIVVGLSATGAPAFLFPFGIRKARGARILEWLGGEHADYHSGLFRRDFLDALAQDGTRFTPIFQRILRAIGGIDVVGLARQPGELEGHANPFLTLPSFQNASSAHATRLGTDWEEYYSSKRASGWRRSDRSKLKKLGRLGELSFLFAEDQHTRQTLLTTLFEQKRQGLGEKGIADMFAKPGVVDFYTALAQRTWPDGPAQLCALLCGERIVAVNLGLVSPQRYYYVLHSYDLELTAHSPGRALMYHLMQWSIGQGIPVFDFTIGDEPYKKLWCEETMPLYNSAQPLTLTGRMHAASHRIGEGMKRRIKTDERLWSAAEFVRKRLVSRELRRK